ncbi:hypothetical protein BN1723_020806, partial [Verticillium longisporum]
GAVLQAP